MTTKTIRKNSNVAKSILNNISHGEFYSMHQGQNTMTADQIMSEIELFTNWKLTESKDDNAYWINFDNGASIKFFINTAK